MKTPASLPGNPGLCFISTSILRVIWPLLVLWVWLENQRRQEMTSTNELRSYFQLLFLLLLSLPLLYLNTFLSNRTAAITGCHSTQKGFCRHFLAQVFMALFCGISLIKGCCCKCCLHSFVSFTSSWFLTLGSPTQFSWWSLGVTLRVSRIPCMGF